MVNMLQLELESDAQHGRELGYSRRQVSSTRSRTRAHAIGARVGSSDAERYILSGSKQFFSDVLR